LALVKKKKKKKGRRAGMMAGLYSLPSFFLSFFLFYSDKSRITIDFSFALLGGSPPVLFSFHERNIVLDVVQMPIGGKG
jgi:hypothetical protein